MFEELVNWLFADVTVPVAPPPPDQSFCEKTLFWWRVT